MEKYILESNMKESIEYMRSQDHLSLYGIIHAIVTGDSSSDLFNSHASKIRRYFNDFDERVDDENFMKCLLGHYETIQSRFKIICPSCNSVNSAYVRQSSIKCYLCGFVEGASFAEDFRI